MNENNSYPVELIRIETWKIPTGPPSTEEEHKPLEGGWGATVDGKEVVGLSKIIRS